MLTHITSIIKTLPQLALIGMAVGAILVAPRIGDAQPKKGSYAGQESKALAGKRVESEPDLGFLVLMDFNGDIKGVSTEGATVQKWAEGKAPPITGEMLGEADLKIEIYHKNPKCIRCTHGGQVIEICQ